jgi:hypothetical protein
MKIKKRMIIYKEIINKMIINKEDKIIIMIIIMKFIWKDIKNTKNTKNT